MSVQTESKGTSLTVDDFRAAERRLREEEARAALKNADAAVLASLASAIPRPDDSKTLPATLSASGGGISPASQPLNAAASVLPTLEALLGNENFMSTAPTSTRLGVSSPLGADNERATEAMTVMRELMASNVAAVQRVEFNLEAGLRFSSRNLAGLLDGARAEGRALTLGEAKLARICEDSVQELKKEIKELPNRNPDGFYHLHGRTVEAYAQQISSDRIVRTPYVAQQIEGILKNLAHNQITLVHGDTGSGKTEIAKLAAREHTERHTGKGLEPIVLRGYPGMGSEEMYGHMVLTSSKLDRAATVVARVDKEIAFWSQENPDANDEAKARATTLITQQVLAQNNVTVSEFVLGAVYKAAKEGRVVILDEVNYIPPGLLAKLNDIMTLKPGDRITVQEDGIDPIRIAVGFGIIETGNLNYTAKKVYTGGRFEIDPAHLQRVGALHHDYLPQSHEGSLADTKNPEQKQLYAIALAALLTQQGHMVAPEGALEQVWNLSQFARITQLAFAGRIGQVDPNAFQRGAVQVAHSPEVLISPRTLQRIIQEWRDDGFVRGLDNYVYKHLIDAAVKVPDKQYLYQLGQKFKVFDKGNGWEELDFTKEPNSFSVVNRRTAPPPLDIISKYEVIEALYGAPPARTEWPTAQAVESTRRVSEAADLAAWKAEIEATTTAVLQLLKALLFQPNDGEQVNDFFKRVLGDIRSGKQIGSAVVTALGGKDQAVELLSALVVEREALAAAGA